MTNTTTPVTTNEALVLEACVASLASLDLYRVESKTPAQSVEELSGRHLPVKETGSS
jgi:hypothetical protein